MAKTSSYFLGTKRKDDGRVNKDQVETTEESQNAPIESTMDYVFHPFENLFNTPLGKHLVAVTLSKYVRV